MWTTFNTFQWDLDWTNPDVFCELLDVILTLANVGVDVFRLDAIAFLWKRLGTNCQNQPEVHDIVEALRAAVRIAAPGVIFKAEAIVAPEDLPAYLGTGRHAGLVSDIAYHNSLMVQLWSAMATGSAGLARRALAVPPPKPVTTAWTTYIRCHDDIGWAISDSDAAAVGLSGYEHRAFLSRFFSGAFPGSYARGEVFQANPITGDARISGTLASLAGLEAAVQDQRAGDPTAAERVNLALGRIFLLYAVVYGYGGIPLLYMGDEIGLCNDRSYLDSPELADDNRWVHRPRMDWDGRGRAGRPAHGGRSHLRRPAPSRPGAGAAARACTPPSRAQPVDLGHDAILGLVRRHPAGTLLLVFNVSSNWVAAAGRPRRRAGAGRARRPPVGPPRRPRPQRCRRGLRDAAVCGLVAGGRQAGRARGRTSRAGRSRTRLKSREP